MSLDRSLKSADTLVRHRNVLNRAERLEKLKEAEKWTDAKSVFGLPKVEHRKQELITKKSKTDEAAEGATPAAAGAAPAAKAGAAGAKAPAAAAPAAKAAAPAAKKK
jgi:small basic protein (TIGR04137 family)